MSEFTKAAPDQDGGIRPEKRENSAKSGVVGMSEFTKAAWLGHHPCITSGAEPSSDGQKELEELDEDGIEILRALSPRCLMMNFY